MVLDNKYIMSTLMLGFFACFCVNALIGLARITGLRGLRDNNNIERAISL